MAVPLQALLQWVIHSRSVHPYGLHIANKRNQSRHKSILEKALDAKEVQSRYKVNQVAPLVCDYSIFLNLQTAVRYCREPSSARRGLLISSEGSILELNDMIRSAIIVRNDVEAASHDLGMSILLLLQVQLSSLNSWVRNPVESLVHG